MKTKQKTEFSGIGVHCAFTELVDVATLQPHPRNPNKHGDRQIALLAKVIRHQGWRSPIVVSRRSGFVIAGHGRLQAAALLQVEKVPVDYQDFACEADEYAHLVADNRIAELAEIDSAELAGLLKELDGKIDLELTGFDAEAVQSATDAFDVSEIAAPELKDGDRAPFRQMTFTVHDEQFEEVEAAMKKAKGEGGGESAVNENSNGNALAWICGRFNRG